MSDFNMPNFNVKPVGVDGSWQRDWYLFFLALFQRSGGVAGASSDDLALSMPEDAGVEETKLLLLQTRDEMSSQPREQGYVERVDPDARLEDLQSRVTQMQADIEALKQGTTP